MSDRPKVLDYAKPVRRPSAWWQTEASLGLLSNATLGMIAVGGRRGWWGGLEGLAAGLFVVAFALILTVTFIAAVGVLVAYIDGPTTAAKQRLAWWVFFITAGHCVAFVAAVAVAVGVR